MKNFTSCMMKNTYRTLLFGKLNFSYGTLGHYNSSRARYLFFLWNVTFPVWNIVQLCYGTINSSYGTLHSSYGTLHSSFWNITSLIWNIALSILKYEKKTQAGYSTFFKDTNFQKWDFYITWDTGSFSMIPSLDETRQTMKE